MLEQIAPSEQISFYIVSKNTPSLLTPPSTGPEAPVKITTYPTDANVPPYVDVMFNCTATGNPRTTITWTQDGNMLPQDKRLEKNFIINFNNLFILNAIFCLI